MRTATTWLTCLSKSKGNCVSLSFSAVNPSLTATAERGHTGGGSRVYVSVVGGGQRLSEAIHALGLPTYNSWTVSEGGGHSVVPEGEHPSSIK